MASKGLTRKQQRKLIIEIKQKIGDGLSDEEIIEDLELRPQQFVEYRRKISETDRAIYQNLDSVAIFADYCLKMQSLIKELDGLKRRFKRGGQYTATALVAAVKQKKDIHDSVIKMGQELGFIARKAKEIKMEGSVAFTTMTEKDVKKEITKELTRMKAIMTGQVDMRQELLDVTPDEVKKYIPGHVANVPEEEKISRKTTRTKIKLLLRKKY